MAIFHRLEFCKYKPETFTSMMDNHGRLARWRKWRACDVALFILQPFRCFTYVTAHSLCSFSKLSVASPTSQFILQPFRRFTNVTAHSPTLRCFIYVTAHSPTLISLLLRHRLFTDVTWWAAHVPRKNAVLWFVHHFSIAYIQMNFTKASNMNLFLSLSTIWSEL